MGEQLQLFASLPSTPSQGLQFKGFSAPLWTESKARLIAKYLRYFVMVTKHGAYIDGFAAPQASSNLGSWAAKLVLESEPRLLNQFWLCELKADRAGRLQELVEAQPADRRRRIEVVIGDFNQTINSILASGKIKDSTASFCLLDQRTFECHWATVEAIAQHKQTNKIELFYFLATGWLDRSLAAISTPAGRSKANLWWGRNDWTTLVGMPGLERAVLVCDRFRNELGYTYAYPFPILKRGSSGTVMYHMIHATDHPAAPGLMNRAYRNAKNTVDTDEDIQLELAGILNRPPTKT